MISTVLLGAGLRAEWVPCVSVPCLGAADSCGWGWLEGRVEGEEGCKT